MKVPAALLAEMKAHAASGYPLEVCGVLLGRLAEGREPARVLSLVRVVNQERTSPAVRYEIAPEDLARIQREARAAGREIVGYYHSHPDHPARPSETDRRLAAEGISDGVVHVIVAVAEGGAGEATAWVFREAKGDFEPEPLEDG